MFKVELVFNNRSLTPEEMEQLCAEADQIFASEELNCADKQPGKRVYLDSGRKQDYGHFWAAIFALKDSKTIAHNLQECFWYNGDNREDLIADFIRN